MQRSRNAERARALCVCSTEIADFAGEKSVGGDAFVPCESRDCNKREPIAHEIAVGANEVIRTDIIIDTGEHKIVLGHDNFNDRRPRDLLID